jgi:hypothetical protein
MCVQGFWILEIGDGAPQSQKFACAHRLAGNVTKGELDGLALGGELVSHHHTIYELVVDVDIGSSHVDSLYTK